MNRWKFILIVSIVLLILSPDLFAAESLNNLPTRVQDQFDHIVSGFYDPLKGPAQWLFWTMAGIQIVLSFGFMVLQEELSLGAFMAQLIRITLLWSLFTAFFQHPEWMKSIFNGFTELANRASDGSVPSLDKAIENIGVMWADIWDKVKDNGWSGARPFRVLCHPIVE